MRPMRYLKYVLGYTLPALAITAFVSGGWWVWLTPVYAFVFIPFVELLFKPDAKNLSQLEEEVAKEDVVYDVLLYGHVFLQYFVMYLYLHTISTQTLSLNEQIGMLATMGICCGVIGINVAHELGHRNTWWEQRMAQALLLTSLYMHFFIEHNKGHHKNVSTPHDPSSARYNEPIYLFFPRTIFGTLRSAYSIQQTIQKSKGKGFISPDNTLLRFWIIEAVAILAVLWIFGWVVMLFFVGAAVIGFLLLESVQYIEHYGLSRQYKASGLYERVMPWHSWNSDHILGRVVLYELTRHSDHHYLASRKYQILRHQETAPQLPAGYPAMILLAFVPPLFFKIMNPRVQTILAAHAHEQ